LQAKNHANNDHHQHHHAEDANMRGVFLHILSDTLGSVAVIVTSLLVSNYNCYRVDSVCSIGVSLLTLYMSTELFGQTINSLLKKDLVDPKTDYFTATNNNVLQTINLWCEWKISADENKQVAIRADFDDENKAGLESKLKDVLSMNDLYLNR